MISFNRKSLVIVTSDIHLGDLYCKTNEFEQVLTNLLQDIERGNLPQLKALIILGDTFDLIMNTSQNLCKKPEFKRIYDLLSTINNQGVCIVFVLGNHEIPTTGSYNWVFKQRKREFMNNMWNSGFNYELLNNLTLCQYVVIGRNEENHIVIMFYDSANKIRYNYKKRLINTDRQLVLTSNVDFNDKSYLMTHGHQFEDWNTHHFVTAPWWNIFMGLSEDSKKGLNKFWHEWNTDREDFDYDAFYQYLDSQGIRKTHIKGGHIKNFVQNEIYEKNKRFYINAYNFLKTKRLKGITNIIFGHIHDTLQVRDGNITMTTNGCWLENKQSHFTEILMNGELILNEIR